MKRVLIIDDATTVRMYHRQILQARGFDVDEAVNGYEALEKALKSVYDLFLIDINMPVMDGYTLLRSLRREPSLCGVPAVVISTEAQQHDIDAAYLAGANAYLVKPVRPDELLVNVDLLTGTVH